MRDIYKTVEKKKKNSNKVCQAMQSSARLLWLSLRYSLPQKAV
jgi:hypothetical protein